MLGGVEVSEPEKVDYEGLRKSGYIVQRDPDYFTIRLRVPAGRLTSEQFTELARIAKKYGRGQIHLTTRQGIQIPWVKYDQLRPITAELSKIQTPPGSCGPRVRNISSCVGAPECRYANINTYELAEKLDEKFFDRILPTKVKISVTGCPNACAKPQLNDIGVMGVVKPSIVKEKCTGCGFCARACKDGAVQIVDGVAVIDYSRCLYCGQCIKACPKEAGVSEKRGYTIFVGGNVGRHPRLATKIVDFADEQTIYRVVENTARLFKEEGAPGERLGHLIDRLGVGEFARRVLS
jgi:anaerobic sulfite reductase subunit C